MKKNRWYLRLLALLVLCGALNVTISAAAEAGSSGDPLVTLSYLNETFMDSIMERVDQKIEARNAQLGVSTGTAASTFAVVTLTSAQVLTGDVGCAVMLRVGTAACVVSHDVGSDDGLSRGVVRHAARYAERSCGLLPECGDRCEERQKRCEAG